MRMYDVTIVGAGPIGCRVAGIVVKKGYKVLVLEEHREVGKPVKCAGLVSWRIKELLTDLPRRVIVNKVRYAKIFSYANSCLKLESEKPMYVIDRQAFDGFLAKTAVDAGAEILTSVRFERFRKRGNFLEVITNKRNFKTKILVGTDGANSKVARVAKLRQPNNLSFALQTTVRGDFERDCVELWFGKNLTSDFFGWVVPENEETARIGIASRERVKSKFFKFLKKRINRTKRPDVGGMIRHGLIKKSVANNVLLVGDAACQVKPFSGGGLIYGLIGAGYAGIACIRALKEENFSEEFLKEEYEAGWKGKLKWPIIKGLLLSRLIHGMPDWIFDVFISFGDVFSPIIRLIDVDLL